MSIAQALPTSVRGGSRWLLLGSLALNLFFVGAAVAMVLRGPAPPQVWNPNVFVRVERIAETLPPADATLLRDAIAAHHDAIDAAQNSYHAARDEIHATLRQNPFKIADLRTAMAQTRAARQQFDQVIQGVFADVVPQMSYAGRVAVANWHKSKTMSNRP